MARYETEADEAARWWASLQPNIDAAYPGDRATLARLRRASNLTEAMAEPATAQLYLRLGFRRHAAERDLPRVALIAAVLSQVRERDPSSAIAKAIGARRAGSDEMALVSPLRFKRLVAARSPDELLIAFRRLVALLGKKANVRDLARVLLDFTDPTPERADMARTRFAFAYHGAAGYSPAEDAAENSSSHIAQDEKV